MTRLLLGKPVAEQIYAEIEKRSATTLKLATVGLTSPDWQQYVGSLVRSGQKHGIAVENVVASNDVSAQDFYALVGAVCARTDVSGVLLQQPLPRQLQHAKSALDSRKDLDCLSPLSVANLYLGDDGITPATPTAVINLLDYYGIDLAGKNVVIIGRSNAVGKPLALMMLRRNATVTVCHTKTVGLQDVCRRADIIVSACGSPRLVTRDFVTERSVVVDVGLSFVDGKTCGDVDEEVQNIAAAVSPVPGGVGPVTVATLFQNLYKATQTK